MKYWKTYSLAFLLFGFVSGFYYFETTAFYYNKNITSIFSGHLPFNAKVIWYEGNFSLYDSNIEYPIVLCGQIFPATTYSKNKKKVNVSKIQKISKSKGVLTIEVLTKRDEKKYIKVSEYEGDGVVNDFEIIDKKNLNKNEYKWVDLQIIPLVIRYWVFLGYIWLAFTLVIIILCALSAYNTLKKLDNNGMSEADKKGIEND